MQVERFKNALVYDVELFRNLLLIGFYSYKSNKYKTLSVFPNLNIDERDEILKLIKDRLLIAYNNRSYDDYVLNYMLKHPEFDVEQLWTFSQQVIQNKFNPSLKDYRFSKVYESYDLSELVRIGITPPSLKHIGCMLKHEKLQDLPLDYDKPISVDQFKLIEKYNINDLEITIKLAEKLKDQLIIREDLSKTYNTNLYCESNAKITEKLFRKFYTDETGDNDYKSMRTYRDDIKFSDLIYDFIKFDNPELQEFLTWLKTQTLFAPKDKKSKKRDWKHKLQLFQQLTLSIGVGGIHSIDEPLILKEDENYYILDLDVTSQYPSVIINHNVFPAHLNPDVCKKYLIERVNSRVKYKKLGKKTGEAIYKIRDSGEKVQVNGFFGKYNEEFSVLYDPQATYTVTLGNQLLMIMLIEKLQAQNYKVISANTDGITLHIEKNKLNHVREIYKDWENITGFNLEETYYESYIRKDVNNYLTKSYNLTDELEKVNNSFKYKGCFVLHDDKDLTKGYNYPIIAIALKQYFLNSVPVRDTVLNHRDIYDFCRCEKISKDFTNYLMKVQLKYKKYHGKNFEKEYVYPHEIETVLDEIKVQPSVRFYIAKPLEILINYDNDGCTKHVYIGNVLKKRKTVEKDRYGVIEVEPRIVTEGKQHKREYMIHDLLDDVILDDEYYTLKKEVELACKTLNQNNDGKKLQGVQDNNFASGYFVALFNDYYPVKNFKDYKINYQFYIDETMKIINKIEGN